MAARHTFKLGRIESSSFMVKSVINAYCTIRVMLMMVVLTCSATHWKQDLFMMDKPLKVVRGDRLHGTLTMVRNLKWRRHLKVKLSYTLETTCGQTQVNLKNNPANIRRWPNVGLPLGQRRRRWANG